MSCVFHCLTGLYCPGCGGTRAILYLLKGQVIKSLQYHPLVPYMAAVGLVEAWRFYRSRRNRIVRKEYYEIEVYVGIGIIFINCAVKNLALAVMGVDLIP